MIRSAAWTERTAPLASIVVSSSGAVTTERATRSRRVILIRAMTSRWRLCGERLPDGVVEAERAVVDARRRRLAHDHLCAEAVDERQGDAAVGRRDQGDP